MTDRILFVDDDPNIIEAHHRNLRKRFVIDTALGGDQGMLALESGELYAVIVADMRMPGVDGITFLSHARAKSPDSVRIILTGYAEQKTAVAAVNQGHIFRFLTKPCPLETLILALEDGLKQYRLNTTERELLAKTLSGSIKMLTEILSMAAPRWFGRSTKIRDYMRLMAPSFPGCPLWELEAAAMLSQVGYVTIPPKITDKIRAGISLTNEERDLLTRVPEIGSHLLVNIPRLENVAQFVLYQLKNFDGSGFPASSLEGKQIPLGGRILKVLFDLAQLEDQGLSKAQALDQMQKRQGAYDPEILSQIPVCFAGQMDAQPLARPAGQAVSLRDLAAGQTLRSDVTTIDGTLIISADTAITPTVLEILNNFSTLYGVAEPIYVERQH